MEEIWKEAVGYEGRYLVSNLGRVKRQAIEFEDSLGRTFHLKEALLGQSVKRGYYYVALTKDGKTKSYGVHRLVAGAFIPNPDNLPQVGHLDENNLRTGTECNNKVDNLYWTTAKDNCNMPLYKERISKTTKGENNPFYGKHLSEDHKRKISENHADVSGEKNGFYGKHHSEEYKERLRKKVKCVETGEVFDCAEFAGNKVKRSKAGITRCCKNAKATCGGFHWEYADKK